jgi:hypothetical protein
MNEKMTTREWWNPRKCSSIDGYVAGSVVDGVLNVRGVNLALTPFAV